MVEAEATLTSQNQITIPASIRKVLKLHGKSRIKFQIQEGRVLVSRVDSPVKESEDPALKPFLDLLAKDIKERPDRIKPFPIDLLKRGRSVIEGVEVDLDGPLTGED